MTTVNKIAFKVKLDDKELDLAVRRPNAAQLQEAKQAGLAMFALCLKNKVMMKSKLQYYMREQNLWDDDKQNKLDTYQKTLQDGQKKLDEGGIRLTEAKKIALDMFDARKGLTDLISETLDLEAKTAEGQTQNTEFNTLVALCTVYNDTGKPYYKSLEEYTMDNSEVALEAAQNFSKLHYGLTGSSKDNPEIQFLLENKFVDEQLRFIDKEGNLVDSDGNRVNEDGDKVNELGEVIVQEAAKVERKPFLDDNDNPV